MSLEGTKEIPTFPGNSCFSFVSAGDKGDSEKHRVSDKEEASYLIFYKNRGLTYLSATQEQLIYKENMQSEFFSKKLSLTCNTHVKVTIFVKS